MLLSILEKYKPDSLRTLSLYGVDPSLKRTLISLNEIVSLHSILSLNQIAFGHFIFAIKHNDFELQQKLRFCIKSNWLTRELNLTARLHAQYGCMTLICIAMDIVTERGFSSLLSVQSIDQGLHETMITVYNTSEYHKQLFQHA